MNKFELSCEEFKKKYGYNTPKQTKVLEMETIHADRAPNGWETLPKFTNGKVKILKLC